MDSTEDNKNNDEVDTNLRTLWVGNLHPKVSGRHISELFYQVRNKNKFVHAVLQNKIII